MRTIAWNNTVSKNSMPYIGRGLDQWDWGKVKILIQETFQKSPVQIVIYILNVPENKRRYIPVDNEPTSAFSKAQEAEESLQLVRRRVEKNIIPTPNDLQGLPGLGSLLYNQLGSLYIQNGLLCRKFEPTDCRLAYLQQIFPPLLVTEVITSLHNSVNVECLGVYKTFEELQHPFYWPGLKIDVKHHIH